MKKITASVTAVFFGVLMLALLFSAKSLVEFQHANEIMVIQYPSGKLEVFTEPGPHGQYFGKVTKYTFRDQYWFSTVPLPGQEEASGDSLKIRFNDGAHGKLSGSLSWEMPLDIPHILALHRKYSNQDAIESQLVATVIQKSVYMTGPLMSSSESYASRRNELLSHISDQIMHGIYKTVSSDRSIKDPITGSERTITVVMLLKKPDGSIDREIESPLGEYGIKISNLSINGVDYDPDVEKQIQLQQQAVMAVQTSMANSRKAEQDVQTTQKTGEAEAAKAEWAQKTLMATEVTKADQEARVATIMANKTKTNAIIAALQELEVAELRLKAAKIDKERMVAEGEGEAKKRELIMSADGALDKKLAAWVDVNKVYAEAIKGYNGAWVPSVVMGGNQGTASGSNAGGNGATDLIDLLTAKTATDLSLDIRNLGRVSPPKVQAGVK